MNRLGPGAVLLAAVLWGTVGPAQVLTGSDASPAALGATRLLLGGLVLLAAVPVLSRLGAASPSGGRSPLSPAGQSASPAGPSRLPSPSSGAGSSSALWRWPAVGWLLLAAVSTGVFQAAFLTSVTRTGAAIATVVALGVAPVAAGLGSRIATGERLTARWGWGTVGAVAGTALLLLPGGSAGLDPVGVLLGIAAGGCYGAYTVAAKKLIDSDAPTLPAIALTLVLGGIVLAPALGADPASLVTPGTLALIGWLAIPATALAYVLFVGGLARVSAATAGTLSLAEPLVAALLGVAVLGERFTALSAVGTCVLLGGLVAVTFPRGVIVASGARATDLSRSHHLR